MCRPRAGWGKSAVFRIYCALIFDGSSLISMSEFSLLVRDFLTLSHVRLVRDSSVVRRHYILLLEPSKIRAQYIRKTQIYTHRQYWSGSSSCHFLRFLSNIFKKQSRNLCFTPLLFCMNHNDLPTKWIFIKESARWSGIHYYDVAFGWNKGFSTAS
jgi:hypothetical protein